MNWTATSLPALRFDLFANVLATVALSQTTSPPVLLFTDLVSGPATGNSDNSQSVQVARQDAVIVTVWGKNLRTAPGSITVGGQAARIYSSGNATGPADLFNRHKMPPLAPGAKDEGVFAIPRSASTVVRQRVEVLR